MLKKIKSYFFHNKTDKQILIKNNIWLLFSEIINKGILFIIGIFIIRSLGPEQYGQFTFISSIVMFVMIFIDSRMDQLFMRLGYDDLPNAISLIGYFIFTKFIVFTIFLIFVTVLYISSSSKDIYILFIIFFVSNFLRHINSYLFVYYKAIERMEIEGILKIVNTIIFLFTFLFFYFVLKIDVTIQTVVNLYFVASIFNFIIGLGCFFYFTKGKDLNYLRFNNFRAGYLTFISKYTRSILLLLGSLFAVNLYYIGDQYLLGMYGYTEELGIYGAYYLILINFLNIFRVTKSTINPSLSRSLKNKEKFLNIFDSFTKKILFFSTILTLFLLLFGKIIIPFVLGHDYMVGNSIYVFYLLVLSVYLMVITINYSNTILLFEGMDKKYFFGMLIGGVGNIGINLLLIPRFGSLGAGAATLISVCFLLIYMKALMPMKKNN